MEASRTKSEKVTRVLILTLAFFLFVSLYINLEHYQRPIRVQVDTATCAADGWTYERNGESVPVTLPVRVALEGTDEITFTRLCTPEELGRGMIMVSNKRQHVQVCLDGEELFQLQSLDESLPTSIYEYCLMRAPSKEKPAVLSVTFSRCREQTCSFEELFLCSPAEAFTHMLAQDVLRVVVLVLCVGMMVAVGIAMLWLKIKGLNSRRFSSIFFLMTMLSLWNAGNMWSAPLVATSYQILPWLIYSSLMLLPIPVGMFAYYSTLHTRSRLLKYTVILSILLAAVQQILYLTHLCTLYDMVVWVHVMLALISLASLHAQVRDYRAKRTLRGALLIAVFSIPLLLALVALPMFWLSNSQLYSFVFLTGMLLFILLMIVEAIFSLVSMQMERRKTEAELSMLQKLSFVDGLTGLGNRRAFDEHLEALQKKKLENAMLVFMDLNDLKNTNDMFGHEAGDKLIKNACSCIESVFGKEGKCYRLGGDEFAAVVENPARSMDAYNRLLDEAIIAFSHGQLVKLSIARGFDMLVNADGIRRTSSLWKSNADREMYADKMRTKMLLTREDRSMVEPEHIDEAAGILNTEGFRRNAVHLVCQHPDKPYSLWYYNIKRFKFVNDFLGFEIGDKLIKYISMLLLEAIHEGETCGHISGDCFISLHQFADQAAIQAHFDYIANHLNTFLSQYNISYQLEIGVGIYCLKPEDMKAPNINQMIDWANVAHRSIHDLRGCQYAIFGEDMWQKQWRELYINQTLEQAIQNGDISVWFQPQYDYITGKLTGAEALCRWMHESLGWLSPAEFVAALEHTGQIGRLDAYVREEVCRLMQRWLSSTTMQPVSISVNISRNSLMEHRYIDNLNTLLERYELPRSALRLEITESAYMNQPERLVDTVNQLHNNGYTVEMDDFGSGFSSLNMLKDVPVDLLKLDIRFLQGETQRSKGAQIMNAVVRMARELNIPVLTEGVETKEQAQYLSNIGCSLMQGYFFSKPLTVREFEQLLRSEKERSHQEQLQTQNVVWFSEPETTATGEVYDVVCAAYQIDMLGRIVSFDEDFTRLTGYDSADITSRSLCQIDLLPDEDRVVYRRTLTEKLATQPTLCLRHRILRKDGKKLTVHCLGEPIVDDYTGESRTEIHLQCELEELRRLQVEPFYQE